MTEISAIAAISTQASAVITSTNVDQGAASDNSTESTGPLRDLKFAEILSEGLQSVEAKLDRANDLVAEFAVDDSIPIHQVVIALGEARSAVELTMQIRTRMIEGYREIMNMQL